MHARDIAKQYLKDRDKEKAAKAVEEMAGDDADELNKLRCLVNYYVRDPSKIKFSEEFAETKGAN